ncbi:MAG: S41 family peptidase [Bacteroidia bacterium]|jgi:carboxyl-terminal processing protease
MNSQTKWQPFIYALLIAFGLLLGIWLKPSSDKTTGMFGKGSKIEDILHIIEEAYVDSVEATDLEEMAIQDLLVQLDPHSVYLPAEDLKHANEQLEGEFEGIGVEFSIINDTILVIAAINGGPSKELGIRSGDRIIAVDSESVAGVGITNEMVFKKLRGPKDSKVRVKIYRPDNGTSIEYTIVRNTIPVYSVEATIMLDRQTGFIKISRFGAETYTEFAEALKKLRMQNMQQLIIDLRGNPGGYLKAVTDMADELLDDKKLIVYTIGRTQPRQDFRADKQGIFEQGKIAVLIDEGSASASEILAGAIQDNDRGLVIGRRSFGKGLVQESFELNDGSALRLTVARYYTPSGRCIQKPYDDNSAYEHEIYDRFRTGELSDSSRFLLRDSVEYKTTNGRIVHSGGGIMPDMFVALDTSYQTDFLTQALSANLLNTFVTTWFDRHRKELSRYSTAEQFYTDFKSDLTGEFLAYCATKEIRAKANEFETSQSYIRRFTKALLARQLFRDEGFYTVLSKDDEYIRAALKAMHNYQAILGK